MKLKLRLIVHLKCLDTNKPVLEVCLQDKIIGSLSLKASTTREKIHHNFVFLAQKYCKKKKVR